MAVPLLSLVSSVVAFANDHAYVYFGQPPPWVLVGGQHHGRTASWGRRFVYLLRLRHTVLNLFHVVPHLTAYTRLQLLSVLWVALELTFITAATFRSRPQCSSTRTRRSSSARRRWGSPPLRSSSTSRAAAASAASVSPPPPPRCAGGAVAGDAAASSAG